jgi:hypothetical protein
VSPLKVLSAILTLAIAVPATAAANGLPAPAQSGAPRSVTMTEHRTVSGRPTPDASAFDKTPCVYASDHISMLDTFGNAAGRSFNCAMVFNDAAPGWQGWEEPWFLATYADMSWAKWAEARGTHRQLIITQNLFPASVDGSDWLRRGASGAFMSHAKALARNLVAAGLGDAVIRLAHEANGNWYPDSVPDTPAGDAEWVRFWDDTVAAMRSVPGAHFQFDWCVSSGYRNIPLRSFYPGNGFVNIIGVDVYDDGISAAQAASGRFAAISSEPDGLDAVAEFAVAHGKPMSIPEWGLEPAREPGLSPGGEDPAFVDGIAQFVQHHDVAFQAYFDADFENLEFFDSRAVIAAYRAAFGSAGTAVSTDQQSARSRVPSPAPTLGITGGPANGSTVRRDVTFTFAVQPGYVAKCSLDGEPFDACTGMKSDRYTDLAPGFHAWRVQVMDANEQTSYLGRTFDVS